MESEKKLSGASVGLVIIIVILVIGGIYMWKVNKMKDAQIQSETVTSQDSAELNKMQADLEATDTNTGVDASTVY